MSACLGGYPQQLLLEGKEEDAEHAIMRFNKIFKGNYHLEMQWTGIPEQEVVNKFFREMSKKYNIPLVITCDSHYTYRHESELHRALVTINTGGIFKKKAIAKDGELIDENKDTDESSMFYTPGEYYLKPYHVLSKHFNDDLDIEALANTNKIADMCNVKLPKNLKKFPQIVDNPEKYIMDECLSFLNKYCENMDEAERKVYFDRFEEEYWTIYRMGYCDYFVVVQDIIKYCSDNGILTGPGRGCLIYETPVYTYDGSIKNLGDIKTNDYVITHDGSSNAVLNCQKYDINEDLLCIKSQYGDSVGITLTNDHKVYAKKFSINSSGTYIERSNLDWFKASELSVGDYIFTPWIVGFCNSDSPGNIDLSNYSYNELYRFDNNHCFYDYKNPVTGRTKNLYSYNRYIPCDSEFLYLLGIFTGDGWLCRHKPNIFGLCFNSKTNIDSFNRIVSYLDYNKITYSVFKHKQKHLAQIEIRWPHVAQFIKFHFNRYNFKSNTKHVPLFIKNLNSELITSYIKGLVDSDGHFSNNRYKYSTTSRDLAYDIKYLLNLIRIPSSILHLKRKPDPRGYKNQLNNYGLSIPAIYRDNKFYVNESSLVKIVDGGYLGRITSINTISGITSVYDIEVESNHNYLTSSGIVHNSAAGCLISYCLGITWIDPIEYGLLFSRFLSSSRAKLPLIEFDGYPISENNYVV